jgi:hypothetical protein
MSSEIFDIRELIDDLERTKDQILECFDVLPAAANRKSFAVGDFKESYYNYVACWQMLNGVERADAKEAQDNRDSARRFLSWANDKLAQSMSQVVGFESSDLSALASEFEVKAKRASDALEPHARPAETVYLATEAVTQVSEIELDVRCSVCRAVAMQFKRELDHGGREVLKFNGVASSRYIKLTEMERVFTLLKKKDFPALHEIMFEEYRFDGGLDGYCPKCDKIYCRSHYNVREYWDDGYYDYAMGTCPNGHERELDD